jgi:hypothetical protein
VSVDTSPPRHDTPETPDGPDTPGRRLSRRAKVGVAAVLVSLTAMWVTILVIRLAGDNPDRLDDRATTVRAGQICEQARAALPVVPTGRDAETPTVRADRLDAETAVLAGMVDQLGALTWSPPHDQELVDRWLADWRQHLADRTVYAESVRANGRNDIVFNGAAPDGESITFRMDAFADTNDLAACFTLDDPEITES